jgi:hypothetical protein
VKEHEGGRAKAEKTRTKRKSKNGQTKTPKKLESVPVVEVKSLLRDVRGKSGALVREGRKLEAVRHDDHWRNLKQTWSVVLSRGVLFVVWCGKRISTKKKPHKTNLDKTEALLQCDLKEGIGLKAGVWV